MNFKENLLSEKLLFALISLVYLLGLFIPVMENDSAQHATMAMDIFQRNDFSHLFKGFQPYLDKPHLHFWLAALSFKIFGLHAWSYRIPALLFTALSAISCYKLALIFYSKKAARYASLIFLSGQAVILSNHDVRTDAVLTGATIFAVWQLVAYFNTEKLKNIIFGAIGLAMAFSSKGQLGVFVIATAVGVHLIQKNKLIALFNWKVLIGLLVLLTTISPVLYAYYIQFGTQGIQFILWNQSFDRMTGTGFGPKHIDHFFFFHTLLWAFLPWGILVYFAFYYKIKSFVKTRFKNSHNNELMTSIGVLLILIVISTSKSKLPHYLNSILPLVSVLMAGYLTRDNFKTKELKTIAYTQLVILTLVYIAAWALLLFVFPVNPIVLLLFLGVSFIMFYNIKAQNEIFKKLLHGSILLSIALNLFLNATFYPNLLNYQSGIKASSLISENNIPLNQLYKIDNIHTWSLDFYSQRLTPTLTSTSSSEELKGKWFYLEDKQYRSLIEKGVSFDEIYKIPHFRITKLTLKFLNPTTRPKTLRAYYLVKS